jgi:transcription elongation factor GreA
MAQEKFKLTHEGYDKLQTELERLIHVDKQENIEALKAARAQGDLSENADYDAARAKQAEIEGRIQEITNILDNCEIIDAELQGDGKLVGIGCTVTIKDLSDNETYEYTIVSTVESNVAEQKISDVSPLGVALKGHAKGDTVKVQVNDKNSYQVKILGITIK